jgi:hypothetical protein
MSAGVAGQAVNRDIHPVAASSAERQPIRGAAVPVEHQGGLPQHRQVDVAGAVQSRLLLHRPEKSERRVRQLVLENVEGRGQQHGAAGAIVAAEGRRAVGGRDAACLPHRASAGAQGHRVHVCDQHSPRRSNRARKAQGEVADLATWQAVLKGTVRVQDVAAGAGLGEAGGNELSDGAFAAAGAGQR